jgi:hypothetical protein
VAADASRGSAPAPGSTPAPSGAHHTLNRIADALGVPVASFFPDSDGPDAATAQAADLVSAFAAIDNPAARRTCLAFVRAMANS